MQNEIAHTHTFSIPSRYAMSLEDIWEGLKKWRVWLFLSTQDIRLQYRRSTLGPLWITLSMAVTIYSIGFLYGKLFRTDLHSYYPHVALGILSWSLISSLINEGVNTFVEAEHFIKQMKQPYSVFVLRTTSRIFLTYFHNIIVIVPIFIVLKLPITITILFYPIALFLVWINGISFCIIFSILNTRFRDLKPIISSFVQVAFYLSPVIWSPQNLGERGQIIVKLNPFAQFLNILREPFLGHLPSMYTLSIVLTITLIGVIGSFFVFSFYRVRIAYWL